MPEKQRESLCNNIICENKRKKNQSEYVGHKKKKHEHIV